MTTAAIHLALIYAAVAVLVAIGILLCLADRSDSIDEHTRQHRESDECPWCKASDARLIEHERQRMRAEQAVRRRDAAERRMRGAS